MAVKRATRDYYVGLAFCFFAALGAEGAQLGQEAKVYVVCATPGEGFWSMAKQKDSKPSKTHLENYMGGREGLEWEYDESKNWNLTGYYGTLLPVLMKSVNLKFKVKMYTSYTKALYNAVHSDNCHMAFAPFTHTPARLNCLNRTSPEGVPACLPPAPEEPLDSKHACCVDFGSPVDTTTVGMIVRKPKKGNPMSALFSIKMLNVLCYLIVATVTAAHFVWWAERHDNPEQFPAGYLDGIDDAIWWATTTITTVGYGDKFPITNTGRMFGLIWMILGLLVYALFAGTFNSEMAAANSRDAITTILDLPTTAKVCTVGGFYKDHFLSKYDVIGYTHETIDECMKDIIDGKSDGLFYDELILLRKIQDYPDLHKSWKVISGDIQIALGAGFPHGGEYLRRTFNRALLQFQSKSRQLLLSYREKYFPAEQNENLGDTPTVNLLFFVPTVIFMSFYPIAVLIDYYYATKEKEGDGSPSKELEMHVVNPLSGMLSDDIELESNRSKGDAGMGRTVRSKTFEVRENELSNKLHSSHGKRMLFADGPEFTGLANEVHSVYAMILRQNQAVANLVRSLKETKALEK